ncbi:hypothetical protein [Catenulispora rubra]|nr:hypothetical protein [Catenulispora rubra]
MHRLADREPSRHRIGGLACTNQQLPYRRQRLLRFLAAGIAATPEMAI